jgi:hypothetical protein
MYIIYYIYILLFINYFYIYLLFIIVYPFQD